MFRYERKYYLKDMDRDHVEALILLHPALFREAYQERVINNIYFDTPSFDFFFDNVNGEGHRKKVRIRWYGESFAIQKKLTLEHKLKRGLLGDKVSHPLFNIDTSGNFDIKQFRQQIKENDLPFVVKHELLSLHPTIINHYTRRYFISEDQKFRITLDWNLNFYKFTSCKNEFRVNYSIGRDIVMEIKYNPENEKNIGKLTQFFPFRTTKSSKYVTGVQKIYGIE